MQASPTSATPLFHSLDLGSVSPSSPIFLPSSRYSQISPAFYVSPTKRPHSSPSPSPPHGTKRLAVDDSHEDLCSPTRSRPNVKMSLPATPLVKAQFSSSRFSFSNTPNSTSPTPSFVLPSPRTSNLQLKAHMLLNPAKESQSHPRPPPPKWPVGLKMADSLFQDSPTNTFVTQSSSQQHENTDSVVQISHIITPQSCGTQPPAETNKEEIISSEQQQQQQQTPPQQHTPRRQAYLSRDALDLPNNNPFAPLPRGVYDGYEGRPYLKYWDVLDKPADREFDDAVGTTIADYMDSIYSTFTVMLSHVGYTRDASVPAVLVLAKDFQLEDAIKVTSIFRQLGCEHLKGIFCYEGSLGWNSWTYERDLCVYQERPNPGCSIGVVGLTKSFTLGAYVRLEDDTAAYALTVAHGLPDHRTPVTPETIPKIQIQQPSSTDVKSRLSELEIFADATLSRHGPRRHWGNPEQIKQEIKDLKKLSEESGLNFGEVAYSEFDVVTFSGVSMNSDWALLKVNDARIGRNYIRSDIFSENDEQRWIPRDCRGVYLSGSDSIGCGMEVSKTGRATGPTVGRINLRYSFVKLGTPTYTTEYAIINKAPRNRFSLPGDSGSVVFDLGAAACGMVIAGSDDEGTILIHNGSDVGADEEGDLEIGHRYIDPVWVSYVTPMELILERIRSVTGKRAELIIVDLDSAGDVEGLVRPAVQEGNAAT